MECIKCKLQYVGKSEFPMNIRINSHRKEVSREDVIPATRHFSEAEHDFNDHATFIIEQIKFDKTSDASKKDKRAILEKRDQTSDTETTWFEPRTEPPSRNRS